MLILIATESSAKYLAVLVSSHSAEADKPFRFFLLHASGTNGFPEPAWCSNPLGEPKLAVGKLCWLAGCCAYRTVWVLLSQPGEELHLSSCLVVFLESGGFASRQLPQQCTCRVGLHALSEMQALQHRYQLCGLSVPSASA